MIIPEPKHFFEALSPSLEDHEEEIFYQHPVHQDIKCNQVGAIYCPEPKYHWGNMHGKRMLRIRNKTGPQYSNIGTKPIVVWECYTGQTCKGSQFYYLNGNPLDLRQENLCITTGLPRSIQTELNAIKKGFIKRSVEHLIKREEYWKRRFDWTPEQLWKILELPGWLTKARKEYKTKAEKKPYVKIPKEDKARVMELFALGWTNKEITAELGWGNDLHKVKSIIRRGRGKT